MFKKEKNIFHFNFSMFKKKSLHSQFLCLKNEIKWGNLVLNFFFKQAVLILSFSCLKK